MSSPFVEKQRQRWLKRETEIQQLSDLSWLAVRGRVFPYRIAFHDPKNGPTNAEIAEYVQRPRGLKGRSKFQRTPDKEYRLRSFAKWMLGSSIKNNTSIYYTSSPAGKILAYFDVDCHGDIPLTEGKKAVAIINSIGKRLPVFWVASKRGFNGYVKIDHPGVSPQDCTATLFEFAANINATLQKHGCQATFEIKGTPCTILEKGGNAAVYGKLPFHNQWNWEIAQEFVCKPIVQLVWFQQFNHRYAQLIPKIAVPLAIRPTYTGLHDTRHQESAFERRRQILWRACVKAGRLLTAEEAEELIIEQGLFTPPVDNPERLKKLQEILDWIKPRFKPELAIRSQQEHGKTVQLRKFERWCLKHVPETVFWTKHDYDFDESGGIEAIPIKTYTASRQFVALILSFLDFKLNASPNGKSNKEWQETIPVRSVRKWIKQRHADGMTNIGWSHHAWIACREWLHDQDIIRNNHHYSCVEHVATKYRCGELFPHAQPKKPTRPKMLFVVPYYRAEGGLHYSWVRSEPESLDLFSFIPQARPPPLEKVKNVFLERTKF